MKSKENKEQMRLDLERILESSIHKSSKWTQFKEAIWGIGLFIFGVTALIGVICFFIYLIDNPTSLAIILGFILLVYMWSKK